MQNVTVVTALDVNRGQPARGDQGDEWAARARLPRWADPHLDRSDPRGELDAGASRTFGLMAVLDAVGTAVALFDPAGRVASATPALDRLLAPDAERTAVWQAARTLAEEARRLATAQRGAWPEAPAERVLTREVATGGGTYRLVAAVPGAAWAAVVVERRLAPVAHDEWLRTSCCLSARECQVARLLAEGRTTSAVASALGISPHTARHHTERVYEKLGVRSRAALGRLVGHGSGSVPTAIG